MVGRHLLLLAGLLLSATTAMAAPIAVGVWNFFQWGSNGVARPPTVLTDEVAQHAVSPGPAPWTFVAGPGGAYVRVQDIAAYGDRFEVFNFEASMGLTSIPGRTGEGPPGFNFDAAALDPDYSGGSFFIEPFASASITIRAVVSPFGGGGAGFRVDEVPIPEPVTLALLGLGLAGLAAARRREATLR